MLPYRNFNSNAHPQQPTAMLILLNATSENRLLHSIKITAGVGITLAMQGCSNLYPTKIDNAITAPPRVGRLQAIAPRWCGIHHGVKVFRVGILNALQCH
jgi:hypothetical protein